MSRLMSVSLTEPQVRDRTKTVTRRLGWRMLKPGDTLTLCRKVMGRKPGEPLVRICDVRVMATTREQLDWIGFGDVRREGFPDWTPAEFVRFFCATHRGVESGDKVTRIEWEYMDEGGDDG